MKKIYISVLVVLLIAILAAYIVYNDYFAGGYEGSTSTPQSIISGHSMVNTSTTGSNTSVQTRSGRVENVEPLTLYRMAVYYRRVVYRAVEYNTSTGGVVEEAYIGFKRINTTYNYVYISIFISNSTSKIVDLIVGLDRNDHVLSVSGRVQDRVVNGSRAKSYAENIVSHIKQLMFPETLYGSDVEEDIRYRVSLNPSFEISSIRKDRIVISNMEFNAYRVVLVSTNTSSSIVNKSYVFAELIEKTWCLVKMIMYYDNGLEYVYELVDLSP
jgi:hypothetical protein